MNVLIADDEELARLRINRMLHERDLSFDWNVYYAENGIEALEILNSKKIDLVFLDIEMPEMSGIELLERLRNRDFKVIFQTAYNEYAIKAFDENACDYLLKPFSQERFNRAVDKVIKSEDIETITVKRFQTVIKIPCRDILYFQSREHTTYLVTDDAEYICDQSLQELEENLRAQFVRIHRNTIVSEKAISKIKFGTETIVTLKNEVDLVASRRQKQQLQERFQ